MAPPPAGPRLAGRAHDVVYGLLCAAESLRNQPLRVFPSRGRVRQVQPTPTKRSTATTTASSSHLPARPPLRAWLISAGLAGGPRGTTARVATCTSCRETLGQTTRPRCSSTFAARSTSRAPWGGARPAMGRSMTYLSRRGASPRRTTCLRCRTRPLERRSRSRCTSDERQSTTYRSRGRTRR